MKKSLFKSAAILCLLLFMQSFFIVAQCPTGGVTLPDNCHSYILYDEDLNPYIAYRCEPPFIDDTSPSCTT